MSYKTLIIIDNTSEMTTLNQEIIKATVKEFINNTPKDNKVAIAVTGETAEYLTDYDDSINTQLRTLEAIEYKDVNAPGADVLMEVILGWKESDVAYRDILYVSCRDISAGSEYTEEELLFEVNGKQYPIYSLACTQNENTSFVKGISSLSRISGGVCVKTDDAVSDAEVEKQLSEMLHKAIEERRKYEEEKDGKDEKLAETIGDEEVDTVSEDVCESDTEIEVDGETADIDSSQAYENVIYEMPNDNRNQEAYSNIIFTIAAFIIALIVISASLFIKRQKNKREEEKYYKEHTENARSKEHRIPFEDDGGGETVCLSNLDDDEDTGTRLLYQTTEGVEITLEDRADPTKYFRVCVRDCVVIGRSEKLCDVPVPYDDSVSSRHCELFRRDGVIYCRDLGSSNGTMINQQKVYQEIKVESGDILRIGRLSFFVQILGDNYGI